MCIRFHILMSFVLSICVNILASEPNNVITNIQPELLTLLYDKLNLTESFIGELCSLPCNRLPKQDTLLESISKSFSIGSQAIQLCLLMAVILGVYNCLSNAYYDTPGLLDQENNVHPAGSMSTIRYLAPIGLGLAGFWLGKVRDRLPPSCVPACENIQELKQLFSEITLSKNVESAL